MANLCQCPLVQCFHDTASGGSALVTRENAMGSSQRAHPVYYAGGYLLRTTDPGPVGGKLTHIPFLGIFPEQQQEDMNSPPLICIWIHLEPDSYSNQINRMAGSLMVES